MRLARVSGTRGPRIAALLTALGYFGFSYYEQDVDRLRAVAIDNGSGCVVPSLQTTADGSYAPLSRPLFFYVKRASPARPEMQAFFRFTFTQIDDIVRTVDYVPLPGAEYDAGRATLEALLAATPTS